MPTTTTNGKSTKGKGREGKGGGGGGAVPAVIRTTRFAIVYEYEVWKYGVGACSAYLDGARQQQTAVPQVGIQQRLPAIFYKF